MEKILLDSDILIWILRGHNEIVTQFKRNKESYYFYSSPISVAEIYAGARPKEIEKIQVLFNIIHIALIEKTIGKITGEFINKYYKSHAVELADAFNAATAKFYDMKLWTLNKKHFPMLKRSDFFKP